MQSPPAARLLGVLASMNFDDILNMPRSAADAETSLSGMRDEWLAAHWVRQEMIMMKRWMKNKINDMNEMYIYVINAYTIIFISW